MAVHIAYDRDQNVAILYCSTSDWAFGPVFSTGENYDAEERAEAFLRWLRTATDYRFDNEPLTNGDPRLLSDKGLEAAYSAWLAQENAQWAREELAVEEEG